MLPALIWSLIGAILMTIMEILLIVSFVALKKIASDHLTPEDQEQLEYLNYAFIPVTIIAVMGSGKLLQTKPFRIELIHFFF